MSTEGGITAMFSEMREQIFLLAFSGVGGAFFRAVFAPEEEWKRRLVQGAAGAVSAIFLGGLLAHVIDTLTSAGPMAYLAGGFLMGSGGEIAVKSLQDKWLGAKK